MKPITLPGRTILLSALAIMLMTVAPAQMAAAQMQNFQAHLTGDQEVPPVDTVAMGQAVFKLNAAGDELSYWLVVTHMRDVTASHIHLGAAGVNGPVVAFLFGPSSAPGGVNGLLAKGTITAGNLTGPLSGQPLSALISAIDAGNAYVNVHTIAYPGGEIRGQIQ